ncbi:MAG: sigma-70 family RNA polymerase sigma factor, partial [Thermoguttaceae bacterium]|nr:sigma-70 family RNA polymerase sigma factor [Thermoguttaceae bacterium]
SRVWQKLGQFDVSRRFHPWIYRIATTQTINLLRESNRRVFAVSLDAANSLDDEKGAWANEIEGREVDPQDEMERLDTATGVRRAMEKLPSKFRQILELVFFQGWSRQSVAEALHLTVSTVSRRITKALEQLSFFLFCEHPELYRERAANLVCA